jgi:hypothetical protein
MNVRGRLAKLERNAREGPAHKCGPIITVEFGQEVPEVRRCMA